MIYKTIKRTQADWIPQILPRNCLLKYVIKGKIEERIGVTERRERRRKQLLGDLKEMREYCKQKEDAQDLTL